MINKSVCIIIPVYNAFEATLACLESVVKYSPSSVKIIAIDDQSSMGSFAEYYKKNHLDLGNSTPLNLVLLKNDKNLGFVGTCNRGMMLESGSDDIILLNSDTVVTKDWISKLQFAAYRQANIATVTPLTNNGTICSVPNFIVDNVLPDFLTLDEYALLIENTSKRLYPIIPTCVGFCTYIKREVLEKVGYFDPVFNKGYGEENDLSLRCQELGYVDILDDTTFIHHKGSLSFGDMKEQLSKDNTILIGERYPNYFAVVSEFCRTNPLSEIQERIQNELVKVYEQKHPKRILHVLHNGPFQEYNHGLGGTEMHVRELIRGLPEFTHWSLITRIGQPVNAYILCAHLGNTDKVIKIPHEPDWLKNIIHPDFFECIHIHHTMHFDRAELAELCSAHPNVLYSVHDYYSLCPFIYMRTKTEKVCTGVECITDCNLSEEQINSFRQGSAKILGDAKQVMAFSESTKTVLNRIFGKEVPVKVLPHGITLVNPPQKREAHSYEVSSNSPLRVAFLSPLIYHKGAVLIVESSKLEKLPNGKSVEWHLWSEADRSELPLDSRLVLHGRYDRATLGNALKEAKIDLIIIPSFCMETFSYTLTESWNVGLPVVVTPYGALKERVESSGAGWVLKDESVHGLVELLNSIFTGDCKKYSSKQAQAKNISLTEISEELAAYQKIYDQLESSEHTQPLLGHLQAGFCSPGTPPPAPSLSQKPAETPKDLKTKIRNFVIESSTW